MLSAFELVPIAYDQFTLKFSNYLQKTAVG